MGKQWKLYKINYEGVLFEEIGGEEQVLVDLRITKSGFTIYPDVDYDYEEIEDYVLHEDS